jgi:hypothetical protein
MQARGVGQRGGKKLVGAEDGCRRRRCCRHGGTLSMMKARRHAPRREEARLSGPSPVVVIEDGGDLSPLILAAH